MASEIGNDGAAGDSGVLQSINISSDSPSAISDSFGRSETTAGTKKPQKFFVGKSASIIIIMLFIHTHTVYCHFSSGPSEGNNQSICESTATTNNQSTRTSNLPESPLVQSHLSAATVLEDGFNSDAHQNHNAAIKMEGPQELDEPELGEVLDPSSPSDNQAEESKTSNNQPEFVLMLLMVKRAAESKKRNADDNVNVNVTQQGQGRDSSSNAEGGPSQTTRASSNKKQKRAPPVTDDSLCP